MKELIEKKHTYTVTVTVSNGEEENTIDFEIEAYSLEEAMDDLQNQLDV